ncbi:heat shock protein 86 family protein, putative [Plasmodium relictum]|uniref:Heat shock protein 86 family protein, putative n=1 Tax=Plasmodium relictum TaxID=85471 RepID=A0A1J1H487_PLARL|nr:heat shock protein 86 family protein, putative [Plasmodium relictum]CRG98416.1 heat shock protein 86 family protein, putative [Plasmodium relictum]
MKNNELDKKKLPSSSSESEYLRKKKHRMKNINHNMNSIDVSKKNYEKNYIEIKDKLKELKHNNKRENGNSMKYKNYSLKEKEILREDNIRDKKKIPEKFEIKKGSSHNTSDLLVNRKDKQKIREDLRKKLEKYKRENKICDNIYKSSSNDQNSFSDKEASSRSSRRESISKSISQNRSTNTSHSNNSTLRKSERSNSDRSIYKKRKYKSYRKSFSSSSKEDSRDDRNIRTKKRNTNVSSKSVSSSSSSSRNSETESYKKSISNDDTDNSYKKLKRKKKNFYGKDNNNLDDKNRKTKYNFIEKNNNNLHKKFFMHDNNMIYNKGKNFKYLYNNITGEKIEVKYPRIPLGYHTTKESWKNYTKWLQKKNSYRFSLNFDQHKIFRRSSSLSPTTWEKYVNISDDEEKKKEKTEEVDEKIEKKENIQENEKNKLNNEDTNKKLKEHGNNTKEFSLDFSTMSSLSCLETESVNEKKKNTKKHDNKSKRERKNEKKKKKEKIKKHHIDKKNNREYKLRKEKKKKEKKKEKKKKEKKKKKHHKKDDALVKKKDKRNNKSHKKKKSKDSKKYNRKNKSKYKKNRKHSKSIDRDEGNTSDTSEQISTSMTSLSFLNEEYDFLDKNLNSNNKNNKECINEDSCDLIKDNKINKEEEKREDEKENLPKEKTKDCEENIFHKNNSLKIDEGDISNKKDKVEEEAYSYHDKSSDNESIGPKPLDINVKLANKQIDYGMAMMPGEGQAIAQFVQKGKRIPRRGEVGLSAEAIEKFESIGYVMSGSRHKRMNAIRMRKENQVYSAEEQRALAMFNYEERTNRENALINDLKEILRKQNETILNETLNKNKNDN